MVRKYGTVNIIDLEATCWEGGRAPEGEQQEIIEVGITEVSLTQNKIIKTRSIPVIPTISTISPYCTQLTGWTLQKIKREGGMSFADACRVLENDWGTRNRAWMSWGYFDYLLFRDQCKLFGLNYPFGAGHYNLSGIYSILNGMPRGTGMKRALAQCGLKLEGTHHRGSDDSRNLAKILIYLKERYKPSGLALELNDEPEDDGECPDDNANTVLVS